MTQINPMAQTHRSRGTALSVCNVAIIPNSGIYKNPYRDKTKSTKLITKTVSKKVNTNPTIPSKEYVTNFHRGIMVIRFSVTISKIVFFMFVMTDNDWHVISF
jgi:hypothetical protein